MQPMEPRSTAKLVSSGSMFTEFIAIPVASEVAIGP